MRMKRHLPQSNGCKSLLLLLVAILLPLSVQAKEVQEAFDGYGYYDGIVVTQVSTFTGNNSFTFTSSKTYEKVLKVIVRVGVGDYLSGYEYSSGASITVNGQQKEVDITNTSTYRGSTSNLDMTELEFDLNEEYTTVTLGGSIGNGTCDFYIEGAIVVYEKDDDIIEYPLWVRVWDDDARAYVERQVTSENRLDIMNDGGSVQYNGDKMIVLKNSRNTGGIISEISDMILYLKGTNKIDAGSYSPLSLSGHFTITTEGNDPGSLQLSVYSPSMPFNPSSATLEQNLIYLPPESFGSVRTGNILVPVKPIVNISSTEKEQPVATNTNLNNKTYNNVLYNLKSDEGSYDATTKSIQMFTTMREEDIDAIVTSYQPGTADYAANFAGITFLVPAGTGKAIVTGLTGENGELAVKIGSNAANIIPSGVMSMTRYEFPYECKQATYVYVYSNSPVVTPNEAHGRAGKKTTVTVGIGSVGVSTSSVQASNPNKGDATAIKTIVAKEQRHVVRKAGWYTISGHQLQNTPTRKGLYIYQGKKVVF